LVITEHATVMKVTSCYELIAENDD